MMRYRPLLSGVMPPLHIAAAVASSSNLTLFIAQTLLCNVSFGLALCHATLHFTHWMLFNSLTVHCIFSYVIPLILFNESILNCIIAQLYWHTSWIVLDFSLYLQSISKKSQKLLSDGLNKNPKESNLNQSQLPPFFFWWSERGWCYNKSSI